MPANRILDFDKVYKYSAFHLPPGQLRDALEAQAQAALAKMQRKLDRSNEVVVDYLARAERAEATLARVSAQTGKDSYQLAVVKEVLLDQMWDDGAARRKLLKFLFPEPEVPNARD